MPAPLLLVRKDVLWQFLLARNVFFMTFMILLGIVVQTAVGPFISFTQRSHWAKSWFMAFLLPEPWSILTCEISSPWKPVFHVLEGFVHMFYPMECTTVFLVQMKHHILPNGVY